MSKQIIFHLEILPGIVANTVDVRVKGMPEEVVTMICAAMREHPEEVGTAIIGAAARSLREDPAGIALFLSLAGR